MNCYKFTGKTKVNSKGVVLNQIVYTESIDKDKINHIGGWIEKEGNLRQKTSAWVDSDSEISGNVVIYGDVRIINSKIYGQSGVISTGTITNSSINAEQIILRGSQFLQHRVFVTCSIINSKILKLSNTKLINVETMCKNNSILIDNSVVRDSKLSENIEITFSKITNCNVNSSNVTVDIGYGNLLVENSKISNSKINCNCRNTSTRDCLHKLLNFHVIGSEIIGYIDLKSEEMDDFIINLKIKNGKVL